MTVFPSSTYYSTRATRRRDRLAAVLGALAALITAAAYYVLLCLVLA